jgi:hypothetical protein
MMRENERFADGILNVEEVNVAKPSVGGEAVQAPCLHLRNEGLTIVIRADGKVIYDGVSVRVLIEEERAMIGDANDVIAVRRNAPAPC